MDNLLGDLGIRNPDGTINTSNLSLLALLAGGSMLGANRPGATFGEASGAGLLGALQGYGSMRGQAEASAYRKAQTDALKLKAQRQAALSRYLMGAGASAGAPAAAPGAGPQIASADPTAGVAAVPPAADAPTQTGGGMPADPRFGYVPPELMPLIAGSDDPLGNIKHFYDKSREAPKVETVYDPKTGREQKWQYDPAQRGYVPIGGTKSELLTADELAQRQAIARSGATQLQIDQRQPDEERKVVGKYFGEAYTKLQDATLNNGSRRAKLQRLDALLDRVDTGTGAEFTLELKKGAKAAGIDLDALGVTDNVGAAEAGRALANEMALELRNPAGGAGMPGALSDSDRNFLASMTPGLSTTKEGRKLIVQSRMRLLDREDQVAQLARDYRKKNGGIDEGFFDELAVFSRANPIFREADLELLQKVGGGAPGGGRVIQYDAQGRRIQ